MPTPKFKIGQLVLHNRFGYRGVVYDIDLCFALSDEWYDEVAKSRPPKELPWYRVLVHDSMQETYVAERHLRSDPEQTAIRHPLIYEHFDVFRNGHYVRERGMN